MRARFLLRVGLFVALLVIVAVAGGTALFLLLSSMVGAVFPAPHAGLVVILVLVLVIFLSGAVRRAAGPIGDLIEAAGRVETGDYSVRVRERGARELRGVSHAFNTMVARLEEDTTQRRRLLADVSHELRTPLSVIQGNIEALIDGVYQADREHLATILEETRTLSRLVDDLRTLALAEAGELPLHREATDVASLLRESVAAFTPQATEAEIRLEVDATDDLPTLEIDPTRTREVVANLLANALRHTPHDGRVTVSARRDEGRVVVEVADTGSGMPPEVVARIFERFYRGPDSTGSGLGLPIARELVVAQGGQISAESTSGVGTTVRFWLPIAPTPGS
jgi:signal transduction histidine kinase